VSVIPAKTRTAPTSAPASSPKAPPIVIAPENYTYLQQEIYRASGIVLDDDKYYLVESRLTPVARVAGLASLDGLCARLRAGSSPELGRKVIEALTTNETMFFRDVAPFEVLRERIIPELLKKSPRKLAIWSAAASSGQEAYSIAMLLCEMTLADTPVEILGTDLSEQILERAREARYVEFEVNRGLPARYLVKYFKREGLDWALEEEIRHMVKFRRFYLVKRAFAEGGENVGLKPALDVGSMVRRPGMQLFLVPLQRHSLERVFGGELFPKVNGLALGRGVQIGIQLLA